MTMRRLRTPLAAVRGYAQLALRHLSRGTVDPDPLRRWLQDIDQSAERLTHLVGELMDVSLLRAGGTVPLQLQPTDLVKLVHERVREHANNTDEAHTFSVQAEAESVIGQWDTPRLGRVLDNLLGNAVKYTDRGWIKVEVASSAPAPSAPEVVVEFRVIDTGVGIPRDGHRQLFKPFSQLESPRQASGTGLGLAIAQQIITALDGRIEVESSPESGTAFTIEMPLAVAEEVLA